MGRLRVLLAEDHHVRRKGLAAIAVTKEPKPAVVVMDIPMPELNGLKATETPTALVSDTRVLILTRRSDSNNVQQPRRSGARDYVLKRSASDELVHAIKRVAAGQAPMPVGGGPCRAR
jgi:DNA-binding NarL/FixJ family response regulator